MQTTVTVSSASSSAWIPLNQWASSFAVSLAGVISNGASLTWKVEHTFGSVLRGEPCTITRSGTTATLVYTNHGLTANDSIIVSGAGSPFDGTYAVASVVDANTITYTVTNTGPTTAVGAKVNLLPVFDHETLVSQTTDADGNYAYPCSACRLTVTSYASGFVNLTVRQTESRG
jgi:hypothetical protein